MRKLCVQSLPPFGCQGYPQEMRSVINSRFLLLLCVAVALVCSEFPETFNLQDDTSNDFVRPLSSPRLRTVKIAHQVLISGRGSIVADVAFRKLAMISSVVAAVPSVPELLRLLSIQRK